MDTTNETTTYSAPTWYEPLKQVNRSWAGRWVAAFGCLSFVYIIRQLFQLGGEDYNNLVNDFAQAIVFWAAIFITWRVSRQTTLEAKTRRAWQLVTLAYFAFGIGQWMWFYYRNALGIEPFPSVVDVCYLAFFPLMFLALLSFPTQKQSTADRIRFLLDSATVIIAGTMLVWYFLISPILEKNTDPVKTYLNIAYIVGDLVLMAGIISVLFRRPLTGRKPLMFMVVGLLNLLVADISFAYITLKDIESSGNLVILWVTGPLLFITASYYQYYETNAGKEAKQWLETEQINSFTWLPYVAIGLGYGVLLYDSYGTWGNAGRGLVIGAVALTSVVLMRQFTAVKENIKLHTERTARESEKHFQSLIQNSSDIVMIFDSLGNIAYQSPSVTRVLGYEDQELIGRRAYAFVHPDDIRLMKNAYRELEAWPDKEILRECRFRHQDGSWRVLEGVARIVQDQQLGTRGILLNARNISERKVLEDKLRHQAFHDPLTELGNRFSFKDRVDEAIMLAKQDRNQVAVLFVDLDDFKNINDSLGHEAGDEIIKEVAQRLKSCLREDDIVARLGGDEFGILLENTKQPENAISVAKRMLKETAKSFTINNWDMSLGMSIGIAVSEAGAVSSEQLFRNADLAMYRAKEEGKHCFVIFEEQMHEDMIAKVELESELRAAVEKGELMLNYQPIVNFNTGEMTGVESLARWKHPVKGFIPPVKFIPLAEQSGQIIQLGHWILKRACEQAKALADKHQKELTITVNISGRQLIFPNFVADVASVLSETGFNPECLILEITESVMMGDTDLVLRVLKDLKKLGLRIAMDDFGTGYSSLSYLQEFPIDILKIDRSFVDGMENNDQKNAVVRTILNLSQNLRMRTVAEGIENVEQLEMLKDLGCEYGQGYYIERPVTYEKLDEILSSGLDPDKLSGQPFFSSTTAGVVTSSMVN